MFKNSITLIFLLLSTSGFSLSGKKLYKDLCASCHNDKIDVIPVVFGQPFSYLKDTMFAMQDDSREDEIMFQMLENLSKKDIVALASYMASKSPCANQALIDSMNGNIKSGEVLAASCVGCHQLNNHNSDTPWLAGQRTLYLAESIKKFRDEYRNNNHQMLYTASELSDENILDMAAYFNSISQCK